MYYYLSDSRPSANGPAHVARQCCPREFADDVGGDPSLDFDDIGLPAIAPFVPVAAQRMCIRQPGSSGYRTGLSCKPVKMRWPMPLK
jgi:hypothetical protein